MRRRATLAFQPCQRGRGMLARSEDEGRSDRPGYLRPRRPTRHRADRSGSWLLQAVRVRFLEEAVKEVSVSSPTDYSVGLISKATGFANRHLNLLLLLQRQWSGRLEDAVLIDRF